MPTTRNQARLQAQEPAAPPTPAQPARGRGRGSAAAASPSNAGRGRGRGGRGPAPDRSGAPRRIVLADVIAAFESLGKTDIEDAGPAGRRPNKPINRKRTVTNKISSARGFVRKYLTLRKNIQSPTVEQIEVVDWREIMPNADATTQLLVDAYPNLNTRNSITGYLKSAINVLKYRSFGWSIEDFNKFNDFMSKQANQSKTNQQQGAVPQVLQENPTLTFSKLKEVEQRWRQEEGGSIDHLNLALRTLTPPARDDTYSRLKYVTRLPASNAANDMWNYVLVSEDETKPVKIDYRRYKTSDSYPRMLLNLQTGVDEVGMQGADNDYSDICPDLSVLAEILRTSWKDRQREFVMSSGRADTFSTARASTILQDVMERAVGVRLGIQPLRRLATAWAFSQPNWTLAMRTKWARLMQHSVSMSMQYDMPTRRENEPATEDDLPLEVTRKILQVDKLEQDLKDIRKAVRAAVIALRAVI